MKTNKIITSLTALTLLTTVLFATPIVNAQTAGSTGKSNFFSGLITALEQKFGLDKTQVQTVVTAYQQQQKQNMAQNMQARQKSRLDALVTQGKITSAQEQAIITEIAALQNKYNPNSMKSMTGAQRKTQIQNEQNDIKTWAQSQGIDPTYVMPGPGMGGFRGGMKGGRWNKPSPSPTPSQ